MINPEKKADQLLASGEPSDWQELEPGERDEVLTHLRSRGLIEPAEWLHFDTLLRSSALTLDELSGIKNIVARIKQKISDNAKTDPAPPLYSTPPTKLPDIPPLEIPPPDSGIFQETCDDVELEQILSETELVERFDALGFELPVLHDMWTEYYAKNLYLKPGDILEIPDVTEGAMQAFEAGVCEGRIDTIMFDYARFHDGFALRISKKSTPQGEQTMFNSTKHFPANFMEEFLDGRVIDLQRLQRSLTPGERALINQQYQYTAPQPHNVRLIGIKTGNEENLFQRQTFHEARSTIIEEPYTNIIDLGTLVRLLHFMKHWDEIWYRNFVESLSDMSSDGHASFPHILLNNFSIDGRFAIAALHPENDTDFITVSLDHRPLRIKDSVVPIVTIQSDWQMEVDDDIPF